MIITDKNQIDTNKVLVMTSIGGSPIHEGHTRVIRNCIKDYNELKNEMSLILCDIMYRPRIADKLGL